MHNTIYQIIQERNAYMAETIRQSQERAKRILALNDRLTLLGEKIHALKG
ncbi:hypothetical protein [Spirosoma endophyticum]|uniref:Uncharacterized protein n=1 Tax=Spirosoma endophyticum TaxID=662367 RepID=A0A1I2EQZ3_9BACT|nr:hypothetical protein [Spirosoma endophyticum]SFE95123.1 hypothetical protein SAMN05216167_1235 [Spirosoma endophyticum]